MPLSWYSHAGSLFNIQCTVSIYRGILYIVKLVYIEDLLWCTFSIYMDPFFSTVQRTVIIYTEVSKYREPLYSAQLLVIIVTT